MKNFVLLLLLTTVFRLSARSQTMGGVTIKGVVVDSVSTKPIPFATISVFHNQKIVTGTLSDSLGVFQFYGLVPGDYRLTFSAVGYHKLEAQVFKNQNATLDLGKLKMRPDVKNLMSVTIRGQMPLIEQRPDGINFNAENLATAAGSDGADLLKMVPLVTVDANGGISLRGSSNIKVFIDGKRSEFFASSVADALKMIRADNVVKVEVITNPSARYDAEGADGVINIITRRSRVDATNGNVTAVLANRSEQIMTDVHTKYRKWLFNSDLFYQKYWNRNGSELLRRTGDMVLVQKSESRQLGDYMFGGANVLYSIDSLNTVSIGYRARRLPNTVRTVWEFYSGDSEQHVPSVKRNIRTPNDNNGNSFNVGYNSTSRTGKRELSLLSMLGFFDGLSGYELDQLESDRINFREMLNSKTSMRDFTLQADYTRSFGERWKWEAGAKMYQKSMANGSEFSVYDFQSLSYRDDPERSNRFQYRNDVYAAYTNASIKLKKWAFSLGLRYELTRFNASFKNNDLAIPAFSNIAPAILVNRIVNEKTSLKASYNRKLVRPYFGYLNPTVNQSDSLTAQFGNPNLKPEIIDRYQLSMTNSDPKLFKDVALFFNDNHNTIENIRTPLSGGTFESTYKNIGKNQRAGLSATLTWKPSFALTVGGTVTGQYVRLNSAALGISNSGWMQQLVVNSGYKFGKGFSANFYGFFDSKNLRLQGFRSGWKYYSLTITRKSKDDRINVSLKMDAFLTPNMHIREEVEADSYYQLLTYHFQGQNFRFSISFKLGKKEIKTPKMRHVENAE